MEGMWEMNVQTTRPLLEPQALSPVKAELCGSAHRDTELVGFVNMLRGHFGCSSIQHEVDAAACRRIMLRRGAERRQRS